MHDIVERFSPTERDLLARAADHALKLQANAELAVRVEADFATAGTLAELGLDCPAVAAALLRTVAERYVPGPSADSNAPTSVTEWLAATFGNDVARLQHNTQRARQIEALTVSGDESGPGKAARLERLRKMLLAMAEDIRVVLIMLAERTSLMRDLSTAATGVQARAARDTMDLFAPLANRLGVWQLKWELETWLFAIWSQSGTSASPNSWTKSAPVARSSSLAWWGA